MPVGTLIRGRRSPRVSYWLGTASMVLWTQVGCSTEEVPVGDPVAAGVDLEVRVRVTASRAALGHPDRVVSATGTVRPWREANLRAEVGGRVQTLSVDNGAVVKADDLLLKVDGSRQSIAVTASDARLTAAEEEVARAQEHLERMKTLRAERSVSKVQVEQAQHDYERAMASLKGANADLRGARRQQKDTVVRAPIAGMVTNRMVDQGDTIGPGAPLLDLVDLSKIRITVGVSGRDLARLKPDQTPEVRINDLGGAPMKEVTIAALAPTSNPATGLFDVELHAPNPEGKVRGGMIAAVDLELAKGSPQVMVPREAVTRRNGQLAVFEIVEGRVMLRRVQTGGYDARQIEILDGLQPGALVATSGLHSLAEGVAVEVSNDASAEAEDQGTDGDGAS